MPNVPVYSTPQATPDALPGVRQQAPYRLMQAAEIGPAEAVRSGKAVMDAGSEMLREVTANQVQQNEAAAKDHDASLLGATSAILTEYQDLKGRNAVDAYQATVDKLNALPKDLGQTLQNPAQQEIVRTPTQLRIQAALNQATQHMQQQTDVYQTAASQTRIKVAQDAAPTAYNPITDAPGLAFDQDNPGANTLYQQSLQTIKSEAEDLASRKGMTDPDLRAAFVKDALAKAYVGTLAHLIDRKGGAPGDMKVAQAYFDQVKDQVPPEQADKIGTVLEAGAQKDQALTVALDVKSRVSSIADQEKDLDAQFKAGTITSDVHDMALQKLRADNAQRRSEQIEADKSVLGAAWDLKNNKPGASVTDLTPAQLAYVKNRGLGPHVDSIFASGPTVDDSKLYNDLMRMSVDDAPAFYRTDLTSMSGNLTPSHWNHLIELQSRVGKADIKAMEINRVIDGAVRDTQLSLAAAGLNTKPQPGTGAARDYENFLANLRDALIVAQDAKKDVPLKREEARQIALGMLKEKTLATAGMPFSLDGGWANWLGLGSLQERKPVWKMTEEERAKPWEIPVADYDKIVISLRKQGVPVTDSNVQRAYKLAHGVR